MPYEISWLVPNRILKMSVSGELIRGEIQEIYKKQMETVREEGEVPVHAIVDASEITNIKIKLNEISGFLDPSGGDLFGWTIIVTENRFMRFLTAMFSKMTGSNFKTVDTYEEALEILHKQVPDLLSQAE